MASIPSGTEAARPFVPAKDFNLSKRFYLKLGFEIVLDADDIAIFRIGTSSFLLHPFDQAENFMMQLMVDDLDSWWARIESLRLKGDFGVPEPRPRRCSLGACGWRTSSILPACSGTLPSGGRRRRTMREAGRTRQRDESAKGMLRMEAPRSISGQVHGAVRRPSGDCDHHAAIE